MAQTILIITVTLLPFVATMPTQTLVIKYHHLASATQKLIPIEIKDPNLMVAFPTIIPDVERAVVPQSSSKMMGLLS